MKPSDPESINLFKRNFGRSSAGAYFDADQFDEFIEMALPQDFPLSRSKKIEYIDVPASFDIETTSFYDKEQRKAATMYIWMFSVNGCVIVGRSWQEFILFVYELQDALSLDPGIRRLVCYVENLGFEFQFIKNRFQWQDMFAMEMRRPIKVMCDAGIQFRCSQFLSGMSLDGIGKSLTMFPIRKLSGDLDYSLMRNSKTELTEEEMQYCINDVLVLQAYIYEKILTDGSIAKIPLTKTGYVRKLCRNNCLYASADHKTNETGLKYVKYRRLMNALKITVEEYKLAKRVYQGGFTHGNAFYTDSIIDAPIKSLDFTSSYPFCLIAFKYPMSAGEDYTPQNYADFAQCLKDYWCMFDVCFRNIEASFYYDHYISKSKCLECKGEVTDNGRIVCADYILTSCTGEDFDIIRQTYKWKKMTIYNFRRYRKYYLPTDFIKTVVDLYKKKTVLKGVEGSEKEYMLSKENLNSLYGMCVTDICRDSIEFDKEGWHLKFADMQKCIEDYNESKTRFVSYLWGIACTAYARHNLWRAILECKNDYIYSDTDSIKLLNYFRHKTFFDRYNLEVEFLLRCACNFHNIPVDDVMPYTQKGVKKIIGVWDDDGDYIRMKFLGAKRYLTEDSEGGLHLTVAGVHKTKAIEYLKLKYKDNIKVFEAFTNELQIPAEAYLDDSGNIVDPKKIDSTTAMTILTPSGKNTHTYCDDAISGILVDYQGHAAQYKEESFVHLESVEYSLSLASEYLEFIKMCQTIYS